MIPKTILWEDSDYSIDGTTNGTGVVCESCPRRYQIEIISQTKVECLFYYNWLDNTAIADLFKK